MIGITQLSLLVIVAYWGAIVVSNLMCHCDIGHRSGEL